MLNKGLVQTITNKEKSVGKKMLKIHRRLTNSKGVALGLVCLTILLCLYYANSSVSNGESASRKNTETEEVIQDRNDFEYHRYSHLENNEQNAKNQSNQIAAIDKNKIKTCPISIPSEVDVNTVEVFKDFEFQPEWMKSKEYWDKSFEDRFERQKMDPERLPLKVIIVPHSHNDPGWLKTFENYFHYQSQQIMNNMVSKLQQHKNLTFIWSEIAFLNAWWEVVHPSKQRALKSLVNSGRVEITTGGWVMTDEANSHIYAIVDQLIEGHQWVWQNLGIKPQSGWSIDPFGHGSTVPYVLSSSGIKGTIIQRIHYAWKQWLAWKQYGDFKWVPNWSPHDPTGIMLTHNQPFDIYSIKHSCGPHPSMCLNFDFRKVPGEYTEYSVRAQNITAKNVKEKAELLLEQYARTGSLFTHNVVLMPLGDDFRYNVAEEWDQQYVNYMKLIEFINENRHIYKAEIKFGTPKDYFDAILERTQQFATLRGDFFVYSDIFSEGRPAYWSGYFTTRPFMKILDRELEHSLRAAEILYTIALNVARQKKRLPHLKVLERDFEKLVLARRNLGLFQHHDAITGTSKSFVMRDYGLKLFDSLVETTKIQQIALQSIVLGRDADYYKYGKGEKHLFLSDLERDAYDKLPKKSVINVEPSKVRKIILFNSLSQTQEQLVQLRLSSVHVRVLDNFGQEVLIQINPVWNSSDGNTKMYISTDEYELVFIAQIPALSLVTYTLHYSETSAKLSTIYCNKCHRTKHHAFAPSKFPLQNTQVGDIQLENTRLKLLFNGLTGFLKTVTRKRQKKSFQCGINFGAYRSAQFHSGAYLFMPDPNERDIEKDVLLQYRDMKSVIITSGAVSSEISVIYGPFLVHTIRIFHADTDLSEAIQVENLVDFETPPKNRETELFMRLQTEVQNGEPPEFYTDSNGFSMQKRLKVEKIGIEGNYFPITTQTYIQDDATRVTLLTNHAQGAASWQPGYLEVMLDRRTLYDDSRGMGEGVVDNKLTMYKFWLLIEDVTDKSTQESSRFQQQQDYQEESMRSFNNGQEVRPEVYSKPTLFANHLSNGLNYPFNTFIADEIVEFNETLIKLGEEMPCDVHLLTLRTQPDSSYTQFPSNSALMVIQRQGYTCDVHKEYACYERNPGGLLWAKVAKIQPTTLTGLKNTGDTVQSFAEIFRESQTTSSLALQTFNISFA